MVPANAEPRLKGFGKYRPYRSSRGWGYWRGNEWCEALSKEEVEGMKGMDCDDHDSR